MLHSISTKCVAKRQCRVQIKLDVIYSEWCIYCGASYKCCARYCGYFVGSFPWSPPAMEQVGEVNNWSDADGVGCVDAGSSWDNGKCSLLYYRRRYQKVPQMAALRSYVSAAAASIRLANLC